MNKCLLSVSFLTLITLANCELPVVISRGAFITPITGVTLYDDVELLYHIISDLPDPPSSITGICPEGATKKSCDLTKHIHNILEDNVSLLTVLNRARTTFGLSDELLPDVNVSKTAFRRVKEQEVNSAPPSDDLQKLVGNEWYEKVKTRLLDRKPFTSGTGENHHILQKRFIQFVRQIAPVVAGGAALLGLDELVDFASSLFVGENGLLRFLTILEATSPEQSIVDLSRRVSEFEAETRRVTADIAEEAAEVQRITNDLQRDVAQHKMDLATVEDSHYLSQEIITDLGSLLFTYGVYFSFMLSDVDCRSGFISPLILPPHLLSQKLTEIAAILPTDMKLAVTLDRIQTYYTTKSASCMYDSHGGLLTVPVPIVYKSADYKLYEYRNIFFAWDHYTCTLESSGRYVVKDIKSNKVFPVEDVDEEKCAPHTTKRCKVPPAGDSAEAYCLTQLLSSSTVEQVRSACKMSCYNKKETILSSIPLQPNVFYGVHIPKDTLTVHCPNHEVYNVTEEVRYGALRIMVNCACVFRLGQKTVGRSTGKLCEGHESITLDVLLPGHWTTLTDFLPFTNDGVTDVTKFQHRDEIFNEHYMDSENEEESFITTEVSIIAVIWNFLHSIILGYVMFKLNMLHGGGGVVGLSTIQMVDAHQHHYCKLEDDLYYILYLICGLCSLAFVPPLLWKVYDFITGQFWTAVEVQADRRLATGVL